MIRYVWYSKVKGSFILPALLLLDFFIFLFFKARQAGSHCIHCSEKTLTNLSLPAAGALCFWEWDGRSTARGDACGAEEGCNVSQIPLSTLKQTARCWEMAGPKQKKGNIVIIYIQRCFIHIYIYIFKTSLTVSVIAFFCNWFLFLCLNSWC